MGLPSNYDDFEMNWVGDWAGRRAMLTPNEPALYDSFTGQQYTFQEMNARANRVGTYLVDRLGLRKGAIICFLSRNRVEPVDLYLACGKTGIILAPLSYRLKKPALDDLLARIQPQVFIYEDHFAELVLSLFMPSSVKVTINLDDREAYHENIILKADHREINTPLAMSDTFLYVHTGGTTAVPKICIISHRQMIWNSIEISVTGLASSDAKKELIIFPFFHIGGWNTFTPIFHTGKENILLREFDPGLLLELIDQGRIDHFGAVEAVLQFMIAHPKFDETDFTSLRSITTAGAPCSKEVMNRFLNKEVSIAQSYGLTEGGPSNFAYIARSDSLEELLTNSESIGTPMFHCDFKIVDQQTRNEVTPGEVGVLCLRSPHSFDGYLNDPERTEKLIDDQGWVFTGDLAVQNESGLVFIKGRADNMFISGGENVSPEEIEQTLMKHDAVAGTVCAGVPDKKWGQAPAALVVFHAAKSATEDELKTFCKEFLAGFKVPKYIRQVETLPLTGAGKLDRNAVAEIFS